jgi:hypothetical protein
MADVVIGIPVIERRIERIEQAEVEVVAALAELSGRTRHDASPAGAAHLDVGKNTAESSRRDRFGV